VGSEISVSRPRDLFGGAATRGHILVDSDGVDLDVGFFHKRFQFGFRITAAVVPAVGDDDQSLARVVRFLHCTQCQQHTVEQRGAAFGLGERQAILNLLQIVSKRGYEFWPVAEFDEKRLIFRIGGFEKLGNRLAGFLELRTHASTGIEDNADRQRGILAAEGNDLLLRFVFVDFKDVLIEPRNEAIERIGNGNGNQNQVGIDADIRFGQRRGGRLPGLDARNNIDGSFRSGGGRTARLTGGGIPGKQEPRKCARARER